jgi:hypothetical protein
VPDFQRLIRLTVKHGLGVQVDKDPSENRRRNLLDLISDYELAGRERRFRIRPDSPLVGKMLQDLGPRRRHGANIVAIERETRCAYKAIHWQILLLIVGMMPFALALQKTGGIDLAVEGLLRLFGEREPRFLLGVLFGLTALIGLFISNTATAVLMTPVALSAAHHLKASPYPFAMIIALAASAAFMKPISSPVNTLVLGPGQYRFNDFVSIGVPFTLLVMAISVLLCRGCILSIDPKSEVKGRPGARRRPSSSRNLGGLQSQELITKNSRVKVCLFSGQKAVKVRSEIGPLQFGLFPSRFRQSDGRGRPSHIVARASPPAQRSARRSDPPAAYHSAMSHSQK